MILHGRVGVDVAAASCVHHEVGWRKSTASRHQSEKTVTKRHLVAAGLREEIATCSRDEGSGVRDGYGKIFGKIIVGIEKPKGDSRIVQLLLVKGVRHGDPGNVNNPTLSLDG